MAKVHRPPCLLAVQARPCYAAPHSEGTLLAIPHRYPSPTMLCQILRPHPHTGPHGFSFTECPPLPLPHNRHLPTVLPHCVEFPGSNPLAAGSIGCAATCISVHDSSTWIIRGVMSLDQGPDSCSLNFGSCMQHTGHQLGSPPLSEQRASPCLAMLQHHR